MNAVQNVNLEVPGVTPYTPSDLQGVGALPVCRYVGFKAEGFDPVDAAITPRNLAHLRELVEAALRAGYVAPRLLAAVRVALPPVLTAKPHRACFVAYMAPGDAEFTADQEREIRGIEHAALISLEGGYLEDVAQRDPEFVRAWAKALMTHDAFRVERLQESSASEHLLARWPERPEHWLLQLPGVDASLRWVDLTHAMETGEQEVLRITHEEIMA